MTGPPSISTNQSTAKRCQQLHCHASGRVNSQSTANISPQIIRRPSPPQPRPAYLRAHHARHVLIHHNPHYRFAIYPRPLGATLYSSHPVHSGAADRWRPSEGAGRRSRARQRSFAFKVRPCRPARVRAPGARSLMGRVSAINPTRGGHRPLKKYKLGRGR